MKLELRYFARIREQLGIAQETVELPDAVTTTGEVRQWLIARGGVWAETLAYGKALRIAYRQQMCDEDTLISAGEEVAFFPPVTGG